MSFLCSSCGATERKTGGYRDYCSGACYQRAKRLEREGHKYGPPPAESQWITTFKCDHCGHDLGIVTRVVSPDNGPPSEEIEPIYDTSLLSASDIKNIEFNRKRKLFAKHERPPLKHVDAAPLNRKRTAEEEKALYDFYMTDDPNAEINQPLKPDENNPFKGMFKGGYDD